MTTVTALLRRRPARPAARPTYTVDQWTTHYRIVGGRTYRDAVARLAGDPTPRLVSFPVVAA